MFGYASIFLHHIFPLINSWIVNIFPDIDECTVDSPDCGVGGTCVNTDGSYECQCASTSTSSGGTDPCVGMYEIIYTNN